MRFDISHAITELYSSAKYVLKGFDYSGLEWYDEKPKPSEEELQEKIVELEAAEPMRLLRLERNRRLVETDWRMVEDYPMTNKLDWKTYRQALRDLPATAEPQLDENGMLTNVTWPEVPE